jgi:hypothetical protein
MRGSIPTYWHQETSVTMPKPPILLNRVDPDYLATQEHFADLFKRYGAPIIVLDLVKQHEKRPRESIVGREFRQAIEVLNESIDVNNKIRYIALDYSKITSISKGKLSKVKQPKSTGFLSYGAGKGGEKERAMGLAGDEWSMMEKSLASSNANKNNSSTAAMTSRPLPPAPLTKKSSGTGGGDAFTNFDEAKKDFGGGDGNFSSKSATGLPVGFDSIAEVNAIEMKIDVLRELEDIANLTMYETGFFCK